MSLGYLLPESKKLHKEKKGKLQKDIQKPDQIMQMYNNLHQCNNNF